MLTKALLGADALVTERTSHVRAGARAFLGAGAVGAAGWGLGFAHQKNPSQVTAKSGARKMKAREVRVSARMSVRLGEKALHGAGRGGNEVRPKIDDFGLGQVQPAQGGED